jgi:hypothetical protein
MYIPCFPSVGIDAIVPTLTIQGWSESMTNSDDVRRERDREKARRWRAANLEHARELDRVKARRLAAAKAVAEGRVVEADIHRPKAALLTEDEKRERRRIKSAAWRAAHLDEVRETNRESMKRAAAARAVAEGREPGKKGPQKLFTAEEKRAKRKAKAEKWNAAHLAETRDYARLRGQAIRDGIFVSHALPRLTEEEARLVQVVSSANRRARVRNAFGRYTKADIIELLIQQESKCALCGGLFGDDGYHVDHFIPLARGGTNDRSNLKLLHPVCNLKKGAKLPSDLGLTCEPVTVATKGDS